MEQPMRFDYKEELQLCSSVKILDTEGDAVLRPENLDDDNDEYLVCF